MNEIESLEIECRENNILIDGYIDCDGEIEITIKQYDEYIYTFINKQNAIDIIEHLQKVFELNDGK